MYVCEYMSLTCMYHQCFVLWLDLRDTHICMFVKQMFFTIMRAFSRSRALSWYMHIPTWIGFPPSHLQHIRLLGLCTIMYFLMVYCFVWQCIACSMINISDCTQDSYLIKHQFSLNLNGCCQLPRAHALWVLMRLPGKTRKNKVYELCVSLRIDVLCLKADRKVRMFRSGYNTHEPLPRGPRVHAHLFWSRFQSCSNPLLQGQASTWEQADVLRRFWVR
jgi:hypothetical protein